MRKRKGLKRVLSSVLAVSMLTGGITAAAPADEAKAAEQDNWEKIQDVVGRYYGEWTEPVYSGLISNQMPDTALLGNGDVGVASGGNSSEKKFYVSKGDFWAYGSTGTLAEPGMLSIGGVTVREKPSEETDENLALQYSKATASSVHDNFYPDNAVNGTMKDDYDMWCTAIGKEHWLQLYFDTPVTFSRWVVKFDEALRPGLPDIEANTASDFKLQVSEDGTEWTDISSVQGNTLAIFDENLENSVTTQYVRLYFTKPTQETTPDSQQNPRARVAEFELYANPKEDTSSEPVEQVFYEKQDILNAEIQTEQTLGSTKVDMVTWLAANDNIIVTELRSQSTSAAEFEVETWANTNRSDIRPVYAENGKDSVTITRTSEMRNPEDEDSWRSKAALTTKIIGADVTAADSETESGKGTLRFVLEPGEKVYVVTAVGGGGRTYTNTGELYDGEIEPAEEAMLAMEMVLDEQDITALDQEREEWWKDYWSASYIDWGTEDAKLNQIQKYYYGAQYIIGSASREGKTAPGLYGIWRTNDTPGWHGDYHLNYNFISAFYGVNSSNRSELILPAAEALFSYMEEGGERAASTAELREINSSIVDQNIAEGDIDPVNGISDAILYPLGIGPFGSTTDDVYINECLAAGYSSYLFTSYYAYTQDDSILEQSYEYLKKCANFYEAWLVKEDGKYTMYGGWCEGYQGKNPAIELATMQLIFKNLLSMSETLDKDADKRAQWEEIYEDISLKPTWTVDGQTVYGLAEERLDSEGGKTDFQFWGSKYSNIVMLDYFLPGDSLGYFSSPEELQIARNTIDTFDTNGGSNTAWNNANNFPRVYPDVVKMRYDIDTIISHLYENVSGDKMAANLRIVDGQHGIEKCGATEAVNSMMLETDKGITKIFPNWYEDKDAVFAGLRTEGAFLVSAEYDGEAQEAKNVTITSEAGEDMTLVSPWAEGITVKDSSGEIVPLTKGTVPNWEDQENATYTFATAEGETYTVEKGETELSDPVNLDTLKELLADAKEHVANGDVDKCIEAVQKLFDKAIAEAEAVIAKGDAATAEEVDNAEDLVSLAIHSLSFTAPDKAALKEAIDLGGRYDLNKYVEEGKAEFTEALETAKEVYENGNALQEEVTRERRCIQDSAGGSAGCDGR